MFVPIRVPFSGTYMFSVHGLPIRARPLKLQIHRCGNMYKVEIGQNIAENLSLSNSLRRNGDAVAELSNGHQQSKWFYDEVVGGGH